MFVWETPTIDAGKRGHTCITQGLARELKKTYCNAHEKKKGKKKKEQQHAGGVQE